MNEREALLRAIYENPDDDTPRLVFADWLQENGDEARAEFIRVQVELPRHTPHTIPWHKCNARARKLLAVYEDQWRGEVPNDISWHYPEFRRGFLERLVISDFAAFEQQATRIFAATPLRELLIRHEWNLAALSRIPHLNRLRLIRGYAVNCTPEDVRLLTVAIEPGVTQLELLNGVSDNEARRLLEAHFGGAVRFLIV